MTSWQDFAADAPELAQRVRTAFTVRRHATMATLRRDGSPRISGTDVRFDDATGELRLGSMPNARKAQDLQRDPRVALHSPTVDPPPGDDPAWPGEAKLAGTAVEEPSGDASHSFRLDIAEAVWTHLAGGRLVIESWHAGRGLRRVERD